MFGKPSAKRFEDVRTDMAPGVAPDSADIGKTVYQRMDEGRVRVLRYQGGKPRVESPPGIYVAKKEYSVVEIGEGAFAGHPELASVSLPDCIETIGDTAFEGCSGIVEIDIPRGTASIRGNAFA